ncbi:hypothetical protein M378DRAFT_127069 [Amanita muscaria Koide BX008]|uniref:DASH complex subunit DAM1 n=1 Tax=Amanita muscaria (strain Koide BX008) TaxID=946122 RepID=A0A0C2TBP8_AMAMK|nr:hypothetical protein M378DRAFT_127069 [Amanita muscaria Koide BX008]
MGSSQTPHRTPLRRVSQGSLFSLSRSAAYPDAPHGLGFIEPAMTELADELDILHTNTEGLRNLSDSLATFNESFASWLYVMTMNSLTIDWPQAPTETSFVLAKRRAEQEALRAMEELKATQAKAAEAKEAAALAAALEKTMSNDLTEAETTYIANATMTTNVSATSSSKTSGPLAKKKGRKPKLTAKEKKERGIELERIIMSLPLEFRGSEPALRRNMELVIEGLMDAPNQTVKLLDLVKPPDLNQARVNKCLIALVNRKAVKKDNSTGTVLYRWQGLP